MAKLTLTDLSVFNGSAITAINNNNAAIETALENTLSRDGTTPNSMSADLDMNSHNILNLGDLDMNQHRITDLPEPISGSEPLRLQDASTLNGGGTITSFPAGGTKGQTLVKSTNLDYSVEWVSDAYQYNVKTYGAVGDGVTDDYTAIQEAINDLIDAGGGTLYFPAAPDGYLVNTAQLSINLSAVTTRYEDRVRLIGDGPASTLIKSTTLAVPLLAYVGRSDNVEAYLSIENLRFKGNSVASSVGISLSKAAYAELKNVVIESFELGMDNTDVEQISMYDCEIRFNVGGVRVNAGTGTTDPNSWTIVNTSVSNNSSYGWQVANANSFTFVGGSTQYNGTIGGGSGQYGAKFTDTGTGYGTIFYVGHVFEGNGGAGDFVSNQSGSVSKCHVTFDTVSFTRVDLTTVGYGTNQISITGTGTNSHYKISNCSFYGYSPYSASALRPAIANTNANAKVEIDGLTTFWSTTEAPTEGVIFLGLAGIFSGIQKIAGSTSGVITTQPQAAAGTFNWNWPTTAGTSGAFLTSGGGGSTAMTWTTPGSGVAAWIATPSSANLATAITDETGSGALVFGTSPTFTTSALLSSGFVFNWASSDVTLTHATNSLAFAGASSGYTFDTKLGVGAGVGSIGIFSEATFVTHVGADKNLYVGANFNLADGFAFGSINDANNTLLSQEFRASQLLFSANVGIRTAGAPATSLDLVGGFATRAIALSLSNGANNNVGITDGAYARIAGPTGAFSISGFSGGVDGRRLTVYNSVAQDMTITNEGGSSTAINRILTLTGADVTLTGVSSATFVYDSTDTRWILVGQSG